MTLAAITADELVHNNSPPVTKSLGVYQVRALAARFRLCGYY